MNIRYPLYEGVYRILTLAQPYIPYTCTHNGTRKFTAEYYQKIIPILPQAVTIPAN